MAYVGEMAVVAGLGLLLGLPAGWSSARLALRGFKQLWPAGVAFDLAAAAWVAPGRQAAVLVAILPVWGRLVRADLAAQGREAAR